jgi:5-methylcytosine-specific restriction endonuclease McrA
MRSKLEIKLKDPKRLFDVLEREVVWWRDRRTCMNPNCRRAVPFQEATVHHVIEHTAGGPTKLANAVLVCTDCATKRKELQGAEAELKEYLHSLTGAKQGGD